MSSRTALPRCREKSKANFASLVAFFSSLPSVDFDFFDNVGFGLSCASTDAICFVSLSCLQFLSALHKIPTALSEICEVREVELSNDRSYRD